MSTNGIQQSTNPYRTSTNTYTNDDGLMEKEQIVKDRATGRIIKKSVWVDKDNSGTFDKGELTSITVFGYTNDGSYANSRTYLDEDGDGFQDPRVYWRKYEKETNGEYKQIKETRVYEGTVDEVKRGIDGEKRLEDMDMGNKNKKYQQQSKGLSEILEYYVSHGINAF